jgi:hypothetical protein
MRDDLMCSVDRTVDNLSIFASTSGLAQRPLSVLMRSKQGELGSLRQAEHPILICMMSVAVGGRCVAGL